MDYVISDLHFNHEDIIEFERTEFKTIEEHNNYLIKMWNKTIVNKEDTVYVLGDIGFHSREEVKVLINKLRGHKILIKGNHDTYTNSFYKNAGFDEVYDHPIYYNSKIILSHEPVKEALNNNYVINIHGHLHGEMILENCDNYICVSAKYINYKPIKLTLFNNKLRNIPNRQERLGNEWYFEYYTFLKYELVFNEEKKRLDTKQTLINKSPADLTIRKIKQIEILEEDLDKSDPKYNYLEKELEKVKCLILENKLIYLEENNINQLLVDICKVFKSNNIEIRKLYIDKNKEFILLNNIVKVELK